MPIVYDAPTGDVTWGDMVEEILSQVEGYTAAMDAVTSLKEGVSSTDVTLVVDDATDFSRGPAEIGDELVWVAGVDLNTGTLTLLPKGRGWRGTSPVAHETGDIVRASPVVPRIVVQRELANQLRALYPMIAAVGTTTLTAGDGLHTDWELPEETESVLDVRYKDLNGNWQRVRQWEVVFARDVTDFPSGVSLRITDVPFNSTVQVVYGTRPVPPAATAIPASLADLGLAAGVKDVLTNGALARILPALDVARLSVSSVSAGELDQVNPVGRAQQVAKGYADSRDLALAREVTAFKQRYPARVHFTR